MRPRSRDTSPSPDHDIPMNEDYAIFTLIKMKTIDKHDISVLLVVKKQNYPRPNEE